MRVKKIIAVCLLGWCAETGAAAGATPDLLDSVKARGTLRVALEGTYPPFNFKDKKTGELAGFDVEFARALADKLGVKVEFVANSCHISTNSVHNAMFARTCMMSRA